MMKKLGGLLFLAVLLLPSAASQERLATIAPQMPKIGDQIVITYNGAAKSANLRNVNEITAELMVMRDAESPVLHELPMKMSGKVWKCSLRLTDAKARLLLLRFASGEMKDDNGENVWDVLVYDGNGKPLKGAHYQRSSILMMGGFYELKRPKDPEGALAELDKEQQLYPDNWSVAPMRWSILMRQKPGEETKVVVKEELEKFYAAHKPNEDALQAALIWYDQTGQRERADQIRQEAISSKPKGKVAEGALSREIYMERDPARRLEKLDRFLRDFPQKGQQLDNYSMMRVNSLVQAGQHDQAAAVLDALPRKDGTLYNNISWPLIEKGVQLEKAVRWAKKGVDLLRSPEPSMKPSYFSNAQWKRMNESALGAVLDTYAYGLDQIGKRQEAELAYREAYDLTKGGQEDINQRLVECYIKNEKYDVAMVVATECIHKGKATDKLIEQFKVAYAKAKGSDAGFDRVVNEAKQLAREEVRKEALKGRVNKAAVDFALKGLDGKTVRLSGLKGKVVVVDFWATWCGPCKASFPYLQQVYEKYKSNPNVVILAVNTWENETGAARETAVKKFIEENKYTFPVLYDEGFVEKYGVEGIPTKFIIDKKGMIQFKSVGFLGGQKMIEEMTLQIEMLLDDKFYSSMN